MQLLDLQLQGGLAAAKLALCLLALGQLVAHLLYATSSTLKVLHVLVLVLLAVLDGLL